MQRVVIDTNVLISSRLSKIGAPAAIMEMIADEKAVMLYSPEIIEEYERVLAYEKFKFDAVKQRATIDEITEIGELVLPHTSATPFERDESDRIFYDAAIAGGAILITGNLKHYPELPFIMTPAEFLDFDIT
jgi:putative PIN family toxin of toxin-antitoxin system